MEKHFGLKCLAAVLLFLATLTVATTSIPAAFKKVDLGQPPPAFDLKDIDGVGHRSEDLLAGKVSVVLFWTTWNPRSLEALADLESLTGELDPGAFQVVAINAEHPEFTGSDMEKIRAAVKSIGTTALVLIDEGLAAFNDYGTMAFPSLLLVDREGKVAFTMAGYPRSMRSDLPDAVKLALGLITEMKAEAAEAYVPKNHALMYYNLGKRLFNKGQGEKAADQLLMSIERDPDFVKPHSLLGVYYKKNGRNEEALKEFERVRELDPRDQEAGFQAAIITLRSRQYPEAQKILDELAAEYPEKEEFSLGLALAYKYQGHEEDYARLKDKAAELYPAEARYYYELGGVAEETEDLEEAAGFYRRALEKALTASAN